MARPKTTIDVPIDEHELTEAIKALQTTGRVSSPEERKADAYYVLDRSLKMSRMKSAAGNMSGIMSAMEAANRAIGILKSLLEIEKETGTGININDESKFRRITHVVSTSGVSGNPADFESVPN